MEKLLLFPPLLVAGCLMAGAYGMIHNQISYTVSPDYFHGFKFQQFRIPADQQNRIGAAIVGWQASWWMGLIIGVPVLAVALILPGWKAYLNYSLRAFGVVALTGLGVGLLGLTLHADNAFYRAGNMHNCSYLGGGIGIISAWIYLIWVRSKLPQAASETFP